MSEKEKHGVDTFTSGTFAEAVKRNAVPAIVAMMFVLIYNLADTFFISQTHNDLMIAVVSLCTPVFLLFMSLGTLFGIGGTSTISRALGEGNKERAVKICSFCFWACVGTGAVCTVLVLLFMDPLLHLLGASANTIDFARTYMTIVTLAGIFSMLSNCYANIIRAEGKPKIAMTGTIVGNLLNVILDPIMISVFHWDVAGAAWATLIGNLVAAAYYVIYYLRGQSELSIRPKDCSAKDGIAPDVLKIGIPASLASLLMSVSQMITNSLMAGYGDLSVAAYGVASKVLMLEALVGTGLGQGVQPLLGYCYGAKDGKRFYGCMNYSIKFGFVVCTVVTAVCFIFAPTIVGWFLTADAALSDAVAFTRIMLVTAWTLGVYFVCSNTLQAMGAAKESLVVSCSRQGIIYIPAIFIMNSIMGKYGLAWAQPVADALSLIIVIVLLKKKLKASTLKAA